MTGPEKLARLRARIAVYETTLGKDTKSKTAEMMSRLEEQCNTLKEEYARNSKANSSPVAHRQILLC